MDRPLVILDTETANPRGAPHLLELGAIRVVEGEVVDTFESLVCPPIPIDPESHAVHGIGDDDVRNAPLAEDVVARFREWVGDDWMAAHGAGFDSRNLAFEYARAASSPPPGVWLDSLALAVKYIPEARDHKLATLTEVLELETEDRHRALSDAVTCWKVIEECIERAGSLETCQLTELLSSTKNKALTIAGSLPGDARLSPRHRALTQAAREGEQVRIVYGDGELAPVPLDVIPRFLFERHKKSYLEAECQQSGLLKTYLIERVQRVLTP